MSKALGLVLKTLRENCGYTQKQVAEILHIDRSTYAYYELGTTEPDLNNINKLAKIFNVDVKALLPNADGKFPIKIGDITEEKKARKLQFKMSGEVDMKDPKIYDLSKEETSFLMWLRVASDEQKAQVMSILDDKQED